VLARGADVTTQVTCFFRLGYLYQDWAESAQGDSARILLQLAAASYDSVLRLDSLNTPALNNLSNCLWDLGLRDRAIELGRRAAVSKPDSDAAFVYNYGTKLESLGRIDEAIDIYLSAARLDSSFELPRRALLELYLDSTKNQDQKRILDWSQKLLSARYANLAAEGLKKFLTQGLSVPMQEEAFRLLIDAYAQIALSTQTFLSMEKRELQEIKRSKPELGEAVDEVIHAYEGETTAIRWWAKPDRFKIFSSLLKMLGDFYYFRGDKYQAAHYYKDALYKVPPEKQLSFNIGAAIYLSAVYIEQGNDLELAQLSNDVLNVGDDASKVVDRQGLYQFHSFLASYFHTVGERAKAIAHLKRAIKIGKDIGLETTPGHTDLLAQLNAEITNATLGSRGIASGRTPKDNVPQIPPLGRPIGNPGFSLWPCTSSFASYGPKVGADQRTPSRACSGDRCGFERIVACWYTRWCLPFNR